MGRKRLPSITTRTLHRRQQHNERGRRLLLSLLPDYYTTLTFLRVVAYVDDSVRKYSSSTHSPSLSLTAASQSAIGHATQSDPLPLSLTPSPLPPRTKPATRTTAEGGTPSFLRPLPITYIAAVSWGARASAKEEGGRRRRKAAEVGSPPLPLKEAV